MKYYRDKNRLKDLTRGKKRRCPLCRCSKDAGHTHCFHCINCFYLQCMGIYNYKNWRKREQ